MQQLHYEGCNRSLGHVTTRYDTCDAHVERIHTRCEPRDVNECCSEQFWHFYLALHTQPGMLPRDMADTCMIHVGRLYTIYFADILCSIHKGTAIDAALAAAKQQFLSQKLGTPDWQRFPGSRKVLFHRLERLPNKFWSQILHSTRIDLTAFGLPVKHVDFKFIDPLFGWVISAKRQRTDI